MVLGANEMSKKRKSDDGWQPFLIQAIVPKIDPKVLQAEKGAALKAEFRMKGGWMFNPWEFDFNLERKNTGSMFDLDQSKNKVYYEVYKKQIVDGVTYCCKITRLAAMEDKGWGPND